MELSSSCSSSNSIKRLHYRFHRISIYIIHVFSEKFPKYTIPQSLCLNPSSLLRKLFANRQSLLTSNGVRCMFILKQTHNAIFSVSHFLIKVASKAYSCGFIGYWSYCSRKHSPTNYIQIVCGQFCFPCLDKCSSYAVFWYWKEEKTHLIMLQPIMIDNYSEVKKDKSQGVPFRW